MSAMHWAAGNVDAKEGILGTAVRIREEGSMRRKITHSMAIEQVNFWGTV